MSVDVELDLWREQWKAAPAVTPAVAAELREKVRRHSRYLRIMLAADILVTVVIGGWTTLWAISSRKSDVVALAAETWIFIVAAWAFAAINRRGLWSPVALDNAAFLNISIRRCRSGLQSSVFGAVLYAFQIVFCVAWIYHRLSQEGPVSAAAFLFSERMLVVWAITVVFAGWVIWYRRKKNAELAYLLSLDLGTV